jgi:crotonobetainyl-CoA:carnitine CoA-transferase CaiB-like acyl-CoA transferase
MNRNKKSICLDLQQADDLEVAHQLMRQSDIRVFASPPPPQRCISRERWSRRILPQLIAH